MRWAWVRSCSVCVDRLLELGQRRIRQARQVLGLVDEHVGLVLQAVNLVVDLLQRARGGEHVLREVAGIVDDQLRAGGDGGGRRASRRRRLRRAPREGDERSSGTLLTVG